MAKVLKFGGTSVGSSARMKNVLDIIERQNASVVVLSAMSGTTDMLEKIIRSAANGIIGDEVKNIIHDLDDKYKRCADELLIKNKTEAFKKIDRSLSLIEEEVGNYLPVRSDKLIIAQGELLTSAIFCMYVNEMGHNAVLLNAPDFIRKNGSAEVDTEALNAVLSGFVEGTYYITQGFICSDINGDIDNLGRGGSDCTAAMIGAALNACEVQVWTDIDGMHNNDPRYVEGTYPIRRMSFDEAAELAYFGAKILHPSAIQPCRDNGIPVLLKDTHDPNAEGTYISHRENRKETYLAVAAKDNITALRIYSARMLMAYGFLRKVFEVFEEHQTAIDMITTSEVAVSLTIDDNRRLPEIMEALSKLGSVEVEYDNSIVCVVGNLGHTECGKTVDIMAAAGDVPVKMISYGASQRSIVLLIDTKDKVTLLRNFNEKLFLSHA